VCRLEATLGGSNDILSVSSNSTPPDKLERYILHVHTWGALTRRAVKNGNNSNFYRMQMFSKSSTAPDTPKQPLATPHRNAGNELFQMGSGSGAEASLGGQSKQASRQAIEVE